MKRRGTTRPRPEDLVQAQSIAGSNVKTRVGAHTTRKTTGQVRKKKTGKRSLPYQRRKRKFSQAEALGLPCPYGTPCFGQIRTGHHNRIARLRYLPDVEKPGFTRNWWNVLEKNRNRSIHYASGTFSTDRTKSPSVRSDGSCLKFDFWFGRLDQSVTLLVAGCQRC